MNILKKPKLLLGLMAVIGSLAGWSLINLAVVKITLFEYIIIELVITILHLMYNKVKKDFLPQS